MTTVTLGPAELLVAVILAGQLTGPCEMDADALDAALVAGWVDTSGGHVTPTRAGMWRPPCAPAGRSTRRRAWPCWHARCAATRAGTARVGRARFGRNSDERNQRHVMQIKPCWSSHEV